MVQRAKENLPMTESMAISERVSRMGNAMREFPALLWSFLYFFFLLTGYYVLRPVRDAMGASADVEAVFPHVRTSGLEGRWPQARSHGPHCLG